MGNPTPSAVIQSGMTAPSQPARPKASDHDSEADADVQKGAVEDDQPHAVHQTTMQGQLGHRSNAAAPADSDFNSAVLSDNGTDFPEPGSSPEHSGQHR
jgi:hypothetical protein